MLVRIRLGELKKLIRSIVTEAGGGTSHTYATHDTISRLSTADRQAIDRQAKFSVVDPNPDEEDLPPHLREPEEDVEACWGPVPPTHDENDPAAMTDPFASDWHIIPRPPIFTKFRGP